MWGGVNFTGRSKHGKYARDKRLITDRNNFIKEQKEKQKMVTENQAFKSAMALANKVKEQADSDWQLVVDKLNQKIADLERELNKKEKQNA